MRRAKDHRPAILKAAAHLFGQKRFHEVLVEDVAASAGIAKGTIYRFYRTKDELLAAICLSVLDDLADELKQIAAQRASASTRLRKMVACALRQFRRRSDFFEVMQREWGRAGLDPKSPIRLRRARARRIYAGVVREGQAAGEFRAMDAGTAADILMGMNRTMLYFGDSRVSPEDTAQVVADMFLHGISNHRKR